MIEGFDMVSPQEALLAAEYDPASLESEFRKQGQYWAGGVFVSHAGRDYGRVASDIFNPIVLPRFPEFDSCFFHNGRSGGGDAYAKLVAAALHFCDKVLIIVSANSLGHAWVAAETDWAKRQGRATIACTLDDTDPQLVHPCLSAADGWGAKVERVDFSHDLGKAQTRVSVLLDDLLRRLPYRGQRI